MGYKEGLICFLIINFIIMFLIVTKKVYKRNIEYASQFKYKLFSNKEHLLMAAYIGGLSAFITNLVIGLIAVAIKIVLEYS